MAVGDLVAVIQSSTANYSYYQPAAGVEVMITSVSINNSSSIFRTDGIILTTDIPWADLSGGGPAAGAVNMKWGVTNSVYMGIYATKVNHSFSGIQIK